MRSDLRSMLWWGGFLVGAAAAASALLGWRVESGSGRAAATVTVAIDPSSTLALEPTGVLFARRTLRPSRSGPSRFVSVRNATGGPLAVRVRAEGRRGELDGVLALRVRAGGRTVYDGTLRRLRAGAGRSFVLPSHETTRLRLQAWIPAGAGRAYEAGSATVRLRLATRTAGVTR